MTTATKLGPTAVILAAEGLAYAMVLPHLPVVVGEQAPWWSVGVLLAAYSGSQFLMLNPISRIAREWGVAPVVAGCLLGTTVGLIMTALSTNYLVLLLGRLVDGLSAGTVVVVTAAHLQLVPRPAWTKALGRLAAIRGGSILVGIFLAATIGLALSDPVEALQTTAWIGAGLTLAAILAVRHLAGNTSREFTTSPKLGEDTRRRIRRHASAQAAQAAVLVIAPALAIALEDQTTSFMAPASAILGLAFGQLVVAPRISRWHGRSRVLALAALLAAAVLLVLEPLVGVSLSGAVIGTSAPIAQAQLLRSRVADGSDDFEANAIAGKAAIVGQVIGPALSFSALSISPLLASLSVAGLGASTVWGPRTSGSNNPDSNLV